jgi:hypothetical protein
MARFTVSTSVMLLPGLPGIVNPSPPAHPRAPRGITFPIS